MHSPDKREGETERENVREIEKELKGKVLLVHLPLKDLYVANTCDPGKIMEHGFFSSPFQYITVRVWDRHFPERRLVS